MSSMSNDSHEGAEIVPRMAERIERRMLELGLNPKDFAAAAGITPQGLIPIRKGERRAYQTKLKVGVARALRWEVDAVDRLLAGEEPIEAILECTVPVAVAIDPLLDDRDRATLLAVYRSMTTER